MKRWFAALRNSIAGLAHGFRHEAAIREEILAFLLAIPAGLLLTQDPWRLLALWGSIALLLVIELINTAIEQLSDRITLERDQHIKFAKDCGSAAVLIGVLIAVAVWGTVIFERFW